MNHTLAHRMSTALRSGCRRAASRLQRQRPTEIPTGVDVVDDPEGFVRLVRLRGTLNWRSMDSLLDALADLAPNAFVHLDLLDARIADSATMLRLERLVDGLEQRRIGIRIVGLDPAHPALAR